MATHPASRHQRPRTPRTPPSAPSAALSYQRRQRCSPPWRRDCTHPPLPHTRFSLSPRALAPSSRLGPSHDTAHDERELLLPPSRAHPRARCPIVCVRLSLGQHRPAFAAQIDGGGGGGRPSKGAWGIWFATLGLEYYCLRACRWPHAVREAPSESGRKRTWGRTLAGLAPCVRVCAQVRRLAGSDGHGSRAVACFTGRACASMPVSMRQS